MICEGLSPMEGVFQRICLWLGFIILTPEALCHPGYHAGALPSNGGCSYCESPSYFEGLAYWKAVELSSEYRISFCSSPAPERTRWLSLADTARIQGFPEVSTGRCKYWIPCDVSLHKWILVISL